MKLSKHKVLKTLLGSSVAMAAALSVTAPAQAAGLQLEEIVVTAEKRDASLQSVSIAVSAITSDDMERSGLTDIRSVALKVPSLQISAPQGVVWTYMRGAGNVNPTAGGDNGVAFHYDGVYMSFATGALTNSYDIERMEILRGPQGTLYGRNSTGGSINVITANPGDEFEASMDASYGNYDAKSIRGRINLPKTGIMRSRISATWDEHDGYQTNNGPSGQTETDSAKNWTLRTAFAFDLSDTSELLIKTLAAETTGAVSSPVRVGGYAPIHAANAAANGTPLAPQPTDPRVVNKDFFEGGGFSTYGFAATYTHEFDGVTFKATGAYYDIERATTTDWDASEASLMEYRDEDDVEQKSLEIQFLSNNDSALEWIVGGYFMDMDNFRRNYGSAYGDSLSGGLDFDLFGTLGVTSYAIFGQSSYHISDNLKATLGLRYAWDEKDLASTNILQFPNPGNTLPIFSLPFSPPLTATGGFDESWEKPMGRFALDWNVSDDNLMYASIARGYKAGGFQTTAVGPNPVGAPLPPGLPAADEETVWSYEIGSKNYFLDRRVQFNVAAYYSETKNIQSFYFTEGSLAPDFANVGDGTAWGIEIDYMALITENLRINGSAGYMNTEYDGIVNKDVRDNLDKSTAGNNFVNSPEWSFSMGAEYVVPTDAGEFSLRADWSYRSRVYFTLFEKEDESQKGYHKLDLRARFDSADGHWNATAYVDNVTNKDVLHTMLVPSALLGNSPTGWYAPPRTYGLRVGYNF